MKFGGISIKRNLQSEIYYFNNSRNGTAEFLG